MGRASPPAWFRALTLRALWLGLAIFAVLALVGRPQIAAQTANEDQGVLAGFISRLLSTPTSRVTIGAVEGALSSDATIRDISVADDAGVYLTIDRIRLNWRRTALLQRRIDIEQLDIGQVRLLRRPQPVAGNPEPGPILPELPLSVEVGTFTLADLTLGEPVLGTAARLSASGSASLGAPAQGLRAMLAVRRLDAFGTADLSLAFVPDGERLDLILRLVEPEGGLAARLAGIPGLPPVRLDATGAGTLDDWQARLAFEGGPEIGATGSARITRAGAERLLGVSLDARIAPLLPAVVAPVFGGSTALNGEIAFADGGGVTIRSLSLASRLAELTIGGSVAADRTLDLVARARAVPNQGDAAAVGDGRLERLAFEGTVRGPMATPNIAGQLDLAGLSTPDVSLAALRARFSATPLATPPGNPNAARTRINGTATASEFVPADEGLAEAIGREITLSIEGEIDAAQVARLEVARLASPNLSLAYAGRLGARTVDGQITAEVARLAAFSRLAGRPLAGRARVGAQLSGNPSIPEISATLSGEAASLRLGSAQAERVLGDRVTLDGLVRLAQGSLSFDSVSLRGEALVARLNGRASASDLGLDAAIELAELARLDERLRGRAQANLRLDGASADPDVSLRLSAADARALGRPITGLTVDMIARRALTAPEIGVTASGSVDGKPLTLDLRASGSEATDGEARAWRVDRLAGTLGSVSLNGSGTLDRAGFVAGEASFQAGNLDDLSPLLLRQLAGRLEARIRANASTEAGRMRQDVAVIANGEAIRFDGLTVSTLAADIALQDAYSRPALRGEARLAGLVLGQERFETLALTATDAGGGVSAVAIEGRARGFDLTGAGRIEPGEPTLVRVQSLRAERGGRVIALAEPATIALVEGGARTEGVGIDVAGGRITLRGLVGQRLDAALTARALPLSAADILSPGLGLEGVVNAEATLTGSLAAPQGPFSLSVTGLSLPAARAQGLPALSITARGRLAGDAAELEASLRGTRGIDLTVSGSVPLSPTGRLDLSARGTLDAALANARVVGATQRVTGRIALDATVRGTPGAPDIQGSASLTGGSFTDAAQGIALTGITGRATGRGDAIQIERLTARTRGEGTLSLTGRIEADPQRGFPADLRITGRNAQLVDSGLARLVANLDLAASGPLATAPRLNGRVDVLSLDVRVPDRLGAASAPLRDARHIAPPPQTRARLAQIARAAAGARRGAPPFRAALDLTINAPGRIFVRGRGLDAELGGALRVGGTTLDPVANGAFELRRGRLTILTQRLDFSRGRLTFAGAGFIPELDFLAETRAGDVTARVAVTGPADAPSFAFSSSPSLPEDEVLSRLLFARAAAGLSPFQAIQLAQAVAQLSGNDSGDLFEGTRRALGVDDLDVGFADGGPTVGLSRAIGDRVRVGIRAGARPESTGAGVDIDLTRRLKLRSEIGGDGRASVGIAIEQEY